MTISLVGGVCAGTDTGRSNYASAGTTVTSSSVTTQVGDLVLVLTAYEAFPGFNLRAVTLSGGTGAFTDAANRLAASGGSGANLSYRIATAAESFSVTATMSSSLSREIVVAVFRSTNGAMSYVAASASTSEISPVSHPQTISGPSYSATANSLVACAVYAPSTGGGWNSGSTLNSFSKGETTSDLQMFLYKGVASAGTETPGFNSSAATTSTVLFLGGVFQESPAYTYARPSSDITKQWTPSTGTDHFAMIDEVTASDADYISATAAGQTTEVKLQAMTAPQAGTSVAISYRVRGITGSAGVTVSMVQGTTVIATDTNRTANGNYTLTVASGTWASVTNWTDIRLRFVST